MDDWVQFIWQQLRIYKIPQGNVVNFDETNINFSVTAKRTLNRKGVKTINIQSASSLGHATCFLGATMEGEKMKPYIIFEAKRHARIHTRELNRAGNYGYPTDMAYSVQPSAWMDEEGMLEWINKVWEPFVRTRQGDSVFMLIMDEFAAHLCVSVKKKLTNLRTLVEMIPGGYTSKLQVMDVGLNQPFKKVYKE